VQAGIVGDCLVLAHVSPQPYSDNHYQDFLSYDMPQLLEDTQLAVRPLMWHMHDCAQAYFRRAVRDVLYCICHGRWIGTGGPSAWPPRSPDFNPLDLYQCGHLKSYVYEDLY
jgi:hypothetical protein